MTSSALQVVGHRASRGRVGRSARAGGAMRRITGRFIDGPAS